MNPITRYILSLARQGYAPKQIAKRIGLGIGYVRAIILRESRN